MNVQVFGKEIRCKREAQSPWAGIRRTILHQPAVLLAARPSAAWFSAGLILAALLASPNPASAQVVPSGYQDRVVISAGAAVSGYSLQYGDRRLLGVSAFIDADTRRPIGLEAEGRWLEFHQSALVHAETYTLGPRWRFSMGRFQPYAKALVGLGVFHYPYGYGTDRDLVIAPGGGVDFRVTRRVRLRLADVEYQYWPQFHFGALSSFGVNSGIRIRIF